jgi:2-amino-4-hydroxy-6-hydroxymethyldihydropteridine diphosphokinase
MTDVVVIGLGGNIGGEPAVRARFEAARAALASLGPVCSARLYRSAPLAASPWDTRGGNPSPAAAGVAGPQPAFVNTAVALRMPAVQPVELIATLLELERLLGRDRASEVRWGPRPIDLDVLVWGARTVRASELEVPHPRLAERKFALAPLVDLLGEGFAIPGVGPAGLALRRVAGQACEEIAETW